MTSPSQAVATSDETEIIGKLNSSTVTVLVEVQLLTSVTVTV